VAAEQCKEKEEDLPMLPVPASGSKLNAAVREYLLVDKLQHRQTG
jgi:hypothetical protein